MVMQKTTVEEPEEEELIVPPLFSFRSLRMRVVLLICGAFTVQGLARGSFGMAAVCFIAADDGNATVASQEEKSYTVDWSVSALSRIHTAFYIGSFISVMVVDRAVKRFGAKAVMAFGSMLSASGCMLTPLVILFIPYSAFATAALRFMMGVGYAFVIPCGSVIISRWFPLFERSTGMAVFTTGNQVGTAIAMLLTAEMCELDLFGGWPLSFEAYGGMIWVFVVLWLVEITNKPREHKNITAVELEYITGKTSAKARAVSIVMRTPYRKIFLSPAVLSICSCSFAQSFVVVALVTYLPKYYQQALGMQLHKNGFFSAAPFVVQIVTKLSFAIVADNIKARSNINQDRLAKLFNAVACFGAGLCILAISFMGAEQSTLIMLLMTASMGLFSGFVPGYNTSIVSVAPMFTATVSAYSQVFSQFGSALAPFLIGLITQNGTIDEWRWVFYIITGILFVAGVIYQAFGKCTAESWAEPSSGSHRSSLATLSMRAQSAAVSMSSKLDLVTSPRQPIDVMVTVDEEPIDARVATLRQSESSKSLLSVPRRTPKEVSFCDDPEVNEYPSMSELREPISEGEEEDEEITVVTGAMS